MAIVGFRFLKIEAETTGEEPEGEISVKIDTPKITKVEKKKLVETEILSFQFEFFVEYSAPQSKMKLVGEIFWDDKNKEDILKQWESEKKVKDEVLIPVLNYALRKCLVTAIKLSEELRIPYPIRLPEIRLKE